MSNVNAEPEDLFARSISPGDEGERREADDDGDDDDSSAAAAAAALTSLSHLYPKNHGSSCNQMKGEEEEEEEEEAVNEPEEEEDHGEEGNDNGDCDDEPGEDAKELEIPQRYTKSGRKRAVSFPLKLLKVLSNKKNEDVIAWTPSGMAFEIRKPKQFVADILPAAFKSAKYSSFTRKLHRWGFMRHYRGEEAGAFYHKMFIKDRLDLVEKMSCHKAPEAPRAVSTAQKQAVAAATKVVAANLAGAVASPPVSVRPVVTLNAHATPQQQQQRPVIRPIATATRVSAPIPPRPVVQPSAPAPPRQHVPSAVVVEAQVPRPAVTAVDLNAAIEMEVTRRLKERIGAAAINRQAIALMEKQQQQAKLNSLLEQRIIALAQQQSRLQASGLALPQIDLAQVYRKLKPAQNAPQIAFRGVDSLPSLPPTNIQGAKTA